MLMFFNVCFPYSLMFWYFSTLALLSSVSESLWMFDYVAAQFHLFLLQFCQVQGSVYSVLAVCLVCVFLFVGGGCTVSRNGTIGHFLFKVSVFCYAGNTALTSDNSLLLFTVKAVWELQVSLVCRITSEMRWRVVRSNWQPARNFDEYVSRKMCFSNQLIWVEKKKNTAVAWSPSLHFVRNDFFYSSAVKSVSGCVLCEISLLF